MNLAQIRELLKIVAESGVEEVEIEEDDFRLVVRRSAPSVLLQAPAAAPYPAPAYGPPAYAPPAPPVPSAPQAPAAPAPNQGAPSADAAPEVTEDKGTTVKAPIVGTFYAAPSPDADPFVEVGDAVKPGDVLCIIEAMKLMNEIESEVAGTVRKILAKNAQAVEYDQPLFVIDEA